MLIGVLLAAASIAHAAADADSLQIPEPGAHSLHVLSPTILELERVSGRTKTPEKGGFFSSLFESGEGESSAGAPEWDYAAEDRGLAPGSFVVKAGSETIPVERVGFRRRVLYAPLKKFDLRIGTWIVLQLAKPIPAGAKVAVTNPDGKVFKPDVSFQAAMDESRLSPAIHVNQSGYAAASPKEGFAGYYLGDLGEMPIAPESGFDLINDATGEAVFHGPLLRRTDTGYTFPCYRQVYSADFSAYRIPGIYRLSVPGLGRSYPFRIDDGIAALFARTYALGLYHQRCGTDNVLPFTRFTHGDCHTAAAAIPTMDFKKVNYFLSMLARDTKGQAAPPLKDIDASLFPFIKKGSVDVSGGHHDAGDYSKYTINSCQLIHHLVFAADAFPGAVELDNLGLPESGDGKSDLLQEAKHEADFLAKMQDTDGGFYFLVYPRERKYEDNVLPDRGDPQIVAPKNTSATAASVAALAQTASSPAFRKQFPEEAALYLEKAKKGWAFLERAWAKHGRDRCYQRLTHYGDFAGDRDEIAWAAVEMFLATGDESIHRTLVEQFDPSNKQTWRWGWWSLYESFGCAARSYGFAEKTGRMAPAKLDAALKEKCQREILSRAHQCARDARESAYNLSFPNQSKRFRNGGWFFASDTAFDITAGYQLDARTDFADAVLGNLNYEAGANPVNVAFLTGTGFKRQHEIVSQYAQNDGRSLPPSGLPLGSVQSGFAHVGTYKNLLKELNYPRDDDQRNPYPFYDRWGDAFNVQTEFTVIAQSRALASLAFWMAQSPLKTQPWKSVAAKIINAPSGGYRLDVPGLDPTAALVVWEAAGRQPALGPIFKPEGSPDWIEAEALWPDGRRAFARRDL